MAFLRRLLGSAGGSRGGAGDPPAESDSAPPPADDEIDAEERARELELLRGEQERLSDLILRQQRYADRSWVPPSQGGPRRSEDPEGADSEKR